MSDRAPLDRSDSTSASQRVERVRLEIEYCVGCRWMMRAAWVAQELLTTFEAELDEVALVPGRAPGVFVVREGDHVLFDRAREGGFPELRDLKQRLRDRIAPGRALGHSDRPVTPAMAGSPEGRG